MASTRRSAALGLVMVGLMLAGAMTSVLVAWVFAYRLAHRYAVQRNSNTLDDVVEQGKEDRLHFCQLAGWGYRDYMVFVFEGPDHAESWPNGRLPGWVRRPDSPLHDFAGSKAFGFPATCLRQDYVSQSTHLPGGIFYTRSWSVAWPIRAELPLAPMTSGFVLDTVFYAALFSSPWVFVVFRRNLRLRRGHCPFCNYDLRGEFSNPCSECGRTANAAAAFHDESGTQ